MSCLVFVGKDVHINTSCFPIWRWNARATSICKYTSCQLLIFLLLIWRCLAQLLCTMTWYQNGMATTSQILVIQSKLFVNANFPTNTLPCANEPVTQIKRIWPGIVFIRNNNVVISFLLFVVFERPCIRWLVYMFKSDDFQQN